MSYGINNFSKTIRNSIFLRMFPKSDLIKIIIGFQHKKFFSLTVLTMCIKIYIFYEVWTYDCLLTLSREQERYQFY